MRARLILFFFLPILCHGQEARLLKLEKLYAPEEIKESFQCWQNESVLVPFQFRSQDPAPVFLELEGKEKWKVEWFELFEVLADFSAGHCGQAKSGQVFDKVEVPDRAVFLEKPTLRSDSLLKWGLARVNVPKSAKPGSYKLQIKLSQGGKAQILPLQITVVQRRAVAREDVAFKTEMWQFPVAEADYYGIKPWTDEHLAKLDVMFAALKGINSNSLTIPLFYDLYNTKIRPLDQMMVQVTRKSDGTYSYDFTNLERYIQRADASGLQGKLSIHNLMPWNQMFFFFDEGSGQMKSVSAGPESDRYREFFAPLLRALSDFLESKNWKDRAEFAFDERDAGKTIGVKNWVESVVSGFGFSFAGRLSPGLSDQMEGYALPMNVVPATEVMGKRADKGWETYLYTSCFEQGNQPNSLLTSDLRDIYFLVYLAETRGYQGILHWAFDLWSSQIKTSAIYSDVPSGDAHWVYPDGELSLRYLVLQDALEEIGKVRVRSKTKDNRAVYQSMARYFLINIESERFNQVQAMKNYLND